LFAHGFNVHLPIEAQADMDVVWWFRGPGHAVRGDFEGGGVPT
jgi:ketol-acid reductoisomerase